MVKEKDAELDQKKKREMEAVAYKKSLVIDGKLLDYHQQYYNYNESTASCCNNINFFKLGVGCLKAQDRKSAPK